MSIHSSLRISAKLAGTRSVWTRAERLTLLKREGRWEDTDSVLGLPKVRTAFKVKVKKKAKDEAAEGAPAEGAAPAAAAAAAPAKGKGDKGKGDKGKG